MNIEENIVYLSSSSTNNVDWNLWKKIDGRWHTYFNGSGWIRSTMHKSPLRPYSPTFELRKELQYLKKGIH